MSSPIIKLMIADDHNLVRKGFVCLLNQNSRISVTGEADNGISLLTQVANDIPDIVITDMQMPEMDGFKVIDALKKDFPQVRIIVLSMFYSEVFNSSLILKGAASCLPKDCSAEDLFNTIEKVYSEGYSFDNKVSRRLLNTCFRSKEYKHTFDELDLSEREIQVLELICSENSNQEISVILDITLATVEFHRKNIYKKTCTGSIVGLVKYAIKNGIISLE